MLRAEESSQQWERTPPRLDQGSFGGCADLRVFRQEAICPVTDPGGVCGKTRLRLEQRFGTVRRSG